MNAKKQRNKRDAQRKKRARAKLFGTAQRPRISIFKSNTHTYLQAIDDSAHHTVAQTTTIQKDVRGIEKIAESIAKKLKDKKISSAIFDRGSYQYHGFIKKLVETIRKNGIRI